MAVLEGTLSKWTNVMKGWQYRWFVLDEYTAGGLLSYYTSKEKMMKGVRRGCVRLKGAVIGIDDQDVNTFTITVDHKTFHFQARDADEREKWVRRLEDTILRYANRSRALWEQQYSGGGSAGSTSYGTPGSSTRRTNNLALFDKKVTEADAYLQLMIEQTTKIDNRIQTLEEGEEALCLKGIHDHANAMLDNIKHTIVLLQITKNTANPINGVYQGQLMNKSETETEASDTDLMTVPMPASVQTGIEVGSECRENRRRSNIAHSSIAGTFFVLRSVRVCLNVRRGAAFPSRTHTHHHHDDDVVLGKFSRPMDGAGVRLCEYMSFGLRQVFFELRSRQIVTQARHLGLLPGWKLGWGIRKIGKKN
uniref:Oxysterol-binding protein-related protein 9 n=1 Tax=Culex pipiens TaxID=7175 RepID=A0A8D8BUZ8_CULPI